MTVQIKESLNWFDADGMDYQKYRPQYPKALGDYLAALVSSHQTALDIGCGTGQLTTILASHFKEVVGVDPSESQIDNAILRPNISYQVSSAETLPEDLPEIDLITVAQAAHWLDLPKFYQESLRVGRKNGMIALISYGVFVPDDELKARVYQFYYDEIGRFWPPERKMVDEGYQTIYFPFKEIQVAPMEMKLEWNLNEFIGYISTWSAVRKAKDLGEVVVLTKFYEDIRRIWGDQFQKRTILWPINMRVGEL